MTKKGQETNRAVMPVHIAFLRNLWITSTTNASMKKKINEKIHDDSIFMECLNVSVVVDIN